MNRFDKDDRVRVDIPDETDPDHGTVVDALEDDADLVTGEEREGVIYRVELETGETADFHWRDLRPPLE